MFDLELEGVPLGWAGTRPPAKDTRLPDRVWELTGRYGGGGRYRPVSPKDCLLRDCAPAAEKEEHAMLHPGKATPVVARQLARPRATTPWLTVRLLSQLKLGSTRRGKKKIFCKLCALDPSQADPMSPALASGVRWFWLVLVLGLSVLVVGAPNASCG